MLLVILIKLWIIKNRQNNPLNVQSPNNVYSNRPVKMQQESQSEQSRMDVNFHKTASDT